ncbi:hypothetical protein BASA61_007331 [Batrachochytrium salamandrivorans]|nr:hypothetical protein BASA61_007331 [Batrachochytrium salamandrivorans]
MILGAVLASSLAILFVSATPAPIPPSSLFFRDIQRRDVVDSDSTTFSPELVNLSKRAQSVVDANTVSRMSKFMQYSAAAYFNNVSVSGKWECGVVCEGDTKDTVIQTVFLQTSGKNTAGIVAVQPSSKTIVVAFRGAVDLSDWITNIQFTKWPAPWLNDGDVSTNHKRVPFPKDLEIHSGFLTAYLDIRSLMMTSIKTAQKKYPGFKLVFTGDASYVSVYSYGEPRIGNSQWADWFDNLSITSYRVTSQGDPVPRLPPSMMGYSHTKQEYFITSDKVTKTCTNSGDAGETTDCSTETLFSVEIYAHMYGYYWASGGRNVPDS